MLIIIPLLLSAVDFLAGIVMLGHSYFAASDFAVYVAGAVLVKGLWSLITSVLAKHYADWMGAIDIISGIVLFLMIGGTAVAFSVILGVVMIVKAIYCWIRFFFGF